MSHPRALTGWQCYGAGCSVIWQRSAERMKKSPRLPLNLLHGTAGAAAGAVLAIALVGVLWFAYLALDWIATDATAFQRGTDLRAAREELVFPIIGCVAVGAGAGWASRAPLGQHRFAWSLAAVFLGSLPVWAALGSLELTPRRFKGLDHPAVYTSEALVVVGPPIVVAAVLSLVRARRMRGRAEPEPSRGERDAG